MKKILALAFVALLAACSSEPQPELKLDFSSMGKVYLDTQDVRIVDRTKGLPQWAPYVGHLFRPSMMDALNRFAADRLQAAGHMGHATMIIKDATMTEQPMNIASGLSHLFDRQQASKYIGRVEISLEAQSPNGTVAVANAYATHAATLPENPSSDEKYAAYSTVLNALMQELNVKLEKSMREHMASFILPSAEDMPASSPRRDSVMPLSMNP